MHIVITGGTRGIGKGLVKYFLKNGHCVTFTGTKASSVNKASNDFKGDYQGIVCNVKNYSNIEELVREATSKFGNIDVWINNAGVDQERLLIKDMDKYMFDKVIDTNIKGVIYGTKIALIQMDKQGYGKIYNLEGFGSDGRMMKNFTLYGSSKSLIRYFSKSVDKEIDNKNIFVGTISPGMVITDLLLTNATEESLKIYNVLADDVDTVTTFLVAKIEEGKKHIRWLTTRKVIYRFIKSLFKKRNIF